MKRKKWLFIFCLAFAVIHAHAQQGFKPEQLRYPRVRVAQEEKGAFIDSILIANQIKHPEIIIRAFKKEQKLEVWAREKGQGKFQQLLTYDFCATSGKLGPKRMLNDAQIPEGFYTVDYFNPASQYFLSFRVSYPNAVDLKNGHPKYPGGNIYVHGNCVTIGCIPITDDKIKELYWLAVLARDAGQSEIPIHIFPCKLDQYGMEYLKARCSKAPHLLAFWQNLKPGFDYFESHHLIPEIVAGNDGVYRLKSH